MTEEKHPVRHGALVGGGIGGTFGSAVGAHVGASGHAAHLKEAAFWGERPAFSRGKGALIGAGIVGGVSGGYGALAGAARAHQQKQKRALKHRATTSVTKSVGAAYQQQLADRVTRRRAAEESRPRKPYFNPTTEQQAASKARRGEQAAFKAGKQFRRVPGKLPSLMSHVKSGPAISAAASSAVTGAALYGLHRSHVDARRELAKADHTTRDGALGAAAGVGAADTASIVGGQAAKAVITRRRIKTGTSPNDEKIWAAHKAKYSAANRTEMHSAYPKELPGWRAQRALAFKNKPAVVGATLAAGGLTGAAIARHHSKNIAKGDRTKEATATVLGGGAAQGVYQGAGYGTKHYVDSRTRKGGKGVTPAQVNRQDKVLKPNKTKYGMRLPKGAPGRDNVGYHRNYPRELPHAGKIRLLGHTHEGRLGVLVGTAATTVGAAGALAASHHHLKKSEPLAIAGKVLKRPTIMSELKRGMRGGFKGQSKVHDLRDVPKREHVRDAYGYPSRHKVTVGDYGGEAKAAFKAATSAQARHSPHSTAFRLGAAAGKNTASLGHTVSRHPEYAISVPSAGAGVGIIHHEIKRGNQQKKGTTVAKSAFGVETIEKFGPPKVTVQEANITRRNEKKNKVTQYGPTKVVTEHKGKTWLLRRPKYHAVAAPQTKPKHGDLVAVSRKQRVSWSDGGALARAHETDARTVTLPSNGLTLKHRRYTGDTMAKNAEGAKHGAKVGTLMGAGVGGAYGGVVHSVAAHEVKNELGHTMTVGQHLKAVRRYTAPRVIAPALIGGAALGAGVGAMQHRQKRKAVPVAKAYVPGTITYHNEQAKLHGRKKASGGRQVVGGVAAAGAGAAAIHGGHDLGHRIAQRNWHPEEGMGHDVIGRNAAVGERGAKYGRMIRRGGVGLAVGGGALAAAGATRFVHHGRKQNQAAQRAQAARSHRNAELDATLAKSAFFDVEKNFLTTAFKGGEEALHGFRGAFTGKATVARTPMVGRGKAVGAAAASGVGKLRPAGVAMTRTPARAAVSAGVSGAAIGSLATKNN